MLSETEDISTSPPSGCAKLPPKKPMIYSRVANNDLLSNKKNMLVKMRNFFHLQDSCVF
jgi:hypothetical protein